MTTQSHGIDSSLSARVLRALFELAQLDSSAHAGALARALSISRLEAARALVVLDAQGLVAADRARLTLPGLAVAARLPALGIEAAPAQQPRAARTARLAVAGPAKVRPGREAPRASMFVARALGR